MNLKSGSILWPQINQELERIFTSLDHDISCDVAIIGGGISGALVAYHLTRVGIETIMIDRRRVGHGSTSASTGLLQYEIDTSLVDLAKMIGKERAIAAYRASLDALLAFEPLVAELDDSCGLAAQPSLYLASNEKDGHALRAECEARSAMGIEVDFIEADRLRGEFGFSRPAALCSAKAFEVDPFRLTMRLIDRSVHQGLRVFDQTEITRFEPGSQLVVLHTPAGARITAKKVVFATGYETMEQIPSDLCRLKSTYAIVSQPIESFAFWRDRCLIWETARPYLYLRTTQDNRAIVGGADEPIVEAKSRDALLEAKTRDLQERAMHLFPEIQIEPEYAWAGTFAETKDGLPYIGALPQFPGCYFALGYGGNGITFSLLAAWIIRDLFVGRESDMSRLFAFGR
ncbi:MAG TPA: FAD-binding oxidoreductase [Humisphaera sp.]|jgi:glycine/D-amino acid oxidase-like deaminating enzyme|nr:FAD-binding oxidoreductase [Humisphaera sp.]